ncbi:hypothetical protein [Breoghania sp.]|uniref:hypothetical protein n=1 Tax=Breoghania sp. TaxID=2065378 RepID=UPI0026073E67|nr:hypothetical protein [Breoghania sp.]MDJ0930815.1 hypothetical protein [Breoghania sp.]
MHGLQVKVKNTLVGQIDHLKVADIDNDGIGTVLIEGAGGLNPENTSQAGVARFALNNLRFPIREAIFAVAENKYSTNLAQRMAVVLTIGGIELDDAVLSGITRTGLFSLAKYRLLLENYIGPIPTSISSTLTDLDMPVSLVNNPQGRAALKDLGFDVLKINQDLSVHWDKDTGDLDLEQAHVSLENGATATVKLTLGGVPQFLFEDPRRAQESLATLTVKRGSIVIEDASTIIRMIELQAKKANVSQLEIRAATVAQIRDALGPLASSTFADDLSDAADRFMQNPERLEVRLDQKSPIPVTQLLGMAATAPQAIPNVLGANVSAD